MTPWTLEDIRKRSEENDSGCWIWKMAYHIRYGLPIANFIAQDGSRSSMNARRAAFILSGREIHGRNVIYANYDCKNPECCVNPAHLSQGTQKKMCARYAARGSYNSPASRRILMDWVRKGQKVSDAQRLEIERMPTFTKEDAKRFSVGIKRLYAIRKEGRMTKVIASNSIFNLAA